MIQIIKYEPAHRQSIIHLITSILEKEFGFSVNETTFPDIFHIPEKFQQKKGNFWVALENHEVVGSIGFLDFGDGGGYLKRMFVIGRLRGKGTAQQLLGALMSHARQNGFAEIYLTTIPEMLAAMKFYEKNGFMRIQSLPNDLPTYGDYIFYQMSIR